MRRSIRIERRLDAPPDAVFAILADHARYDRFDGIHRSVLVNPGDPDPNGLGAVRRVWVGPLRFDEQITAFEPPRRLDYLIRDVKTLPFRHEGASIRLERDGAGTHAVWTSSFEIPIPVIADGKVDRSRERRAIEIIRDGDAARTQVIAWLPKPPRPGVTPARCRCAEACRCCQL